MGGLAEVRGGVGGGPGDDEVGDLGLARVARGEQGARGSPRWGSLSGGRAAEGSPIVSHGRSGAWVWSGSDMGPSRWDRWESRPTGAIATTLDPIRYSDCVRPDPLSARGVGRFGATAITGLVRYA